MPKPLKKKILITAAMVAVWAYLFLDLNFGGPFANLVIKLGGQEVLRLSAMIFAFLAMVMFGVVLLLFRPTKQTTPS